MKKMMAVLGLMFITSTVFAADKTAQCKSKIIKHATSIKSQAKQQIRSTEDMMDAQLDKYGDPTVGMGVGDGVKRGHFQRFNGPMWTTKRREFLSKSFTFLNYQRSTFA